MKDLDFCNLFYLTYSKFLLNFCSPPGNRPERVRGYMDVSRILRVNDLMILGGYSITPAPATSGPGGSYFCKYWRGHYLRV